MQKGAINRRKNKRDGGNPSEWKRPSQASLLESRKKQGLERSSLRGGVSQEGPPTSYTSKSSRVTLDRADRQRVNEEELSSPKEEGETKLNLRGPICLYDLSSMAIEERVSIDFCWVIEVKTKISLVRRKKGRGRSQAPPELKDRIKPLALNGGRAQQAVAWKAVASSSLQGGSLTKRGRKEGQGPSRGGIDGLDLTPGL